MSISPYADSQDTKIYLAISFYPKLCFRIKGAKLIKQYKGEEIIITNPLQLPDPNNIVEYYEPFVIGN